MARLHLHAFFSYLTNAHDRILIALPRVNVNCRAYKLRKNNNYFACTHSTLEMHLCVTRVASFFGKFPPSSLLQRFSRVHQPCWELYTEPAMCVSYDDPSKAATGTIAATCPLELCTPLQDTASYLHHWKLESPRLQACTTKDYPSSMCTWCLVLMISTPSMPVSCVRVVLSTVSYSLSLPLQST